MEFLASTLLKFEKNNNGQSVSHKNKTPQSLKNKSTTHLSLLKR